MNRLSVLLVFVALATCKSKPKYVESFELSTKAEREEKLEFGIEPGQTLSIDNRHGLIEIAVSEQQPAVVAKLIVHARDSDEAEEILDRFSVAVEKTADGVAIVRKGQPVVLKLREGTHRLLPRISFRVTVPAGVKLDLKTGTGDVGAVGGFRDCTIETGYGDVTLSGVEGLVNIQTKTGYVRLTDAHGKTIEVGTDYGSIRLEHIRCHSVAAHSRTGNIRAENLHAKIVTVASRFGNVEITNATGESKVDDHGVKLDVPSEIKVDTRNGDITLDVPGKGKHTLSSRYGRIVVIRAEGQLAADSRYGDVEVDSFTGDLTVSSSYGRVTLVGVFATLSAKSHQGPVVIEAQEGSRASSSWSVASGYGRLDLALPAGFSANLDAKTQHGAIEVNLPIEEQRLRPRHVTGKLGQGGQRLEVTTTTGDIHIRAIEPFAVEPGPEPEPDKE